MDVLSMWACLQDQDTSGQWKQVAGWRKVCDLTLAHLSRLQEYRRGLAEAWPPETNAAARAYLGELDQLIDKVQRTHDTAAANYDALAAATRAIGSTRAELKPIHDEYAAKLRQKQAYEATLADPKAVAGSRLPEQPPVTDADLERLNVQARGLMTGLSGELQQAQVMLRQPPPRTWPSIDHAAGPSEPAAQPPVIPPVVPIPIAASSTAARLSQPTTAGQPIPTPVAPAIGPILGGTGGGLAPTNPGPSPLIPSTLPPQPSIAAPPPLSAFPGFPGRPTPQSQLREPIGPVSRPTAETAKGPTSASPTKGLPPGGLIGGALGNSLGHPGAAVPPRRVNPVGGVIGGGGAGTAPSGAAGSRPGAGRASQVAGPHGITPIGGSPTSVNPRSGGTPTVLPRGLRGDGGRRSWDSDHPWETDEGVPPIVRPLDERGPIDPGPAIGFDR
ncbi:hypothetical protein ONA91_12815 [Micromonospora sp. DR5-3]|nr:hypothetical protein [Micromonospora sp. MP36]MCW3815336.1 hypothetical protein [Micromonospora sp. DR5-3]